MSSPDKIVCKPTPWFLFRAVVMFVMFAVFAVLFYIDGSTGYRKKNEIFFLNKTFEGASKQFFEMNSGETLTPEQWKKHASAQTVPFPDDQSTLPAGLKLPMPWPAVLQDYGKMKSTQWNLLWREYTKERGIDATVPEHPYDAGKIHEQWIVLCFCAALALLALFFLLRTLGRSIVADETGVTSQQGKRVPYTDLKRLDLRKWDTKGLAFIDYDGPSGKGRIRIDGLTYGGFKKEKGEPAEALMRFIRSRFSGEIVEYTALTTAEPQDSPSKTA